MREHVQTVIKISLQLLCLKKKKELYVKSAIENLCISFRRYNKTVNSKKKYTCDVKKLHTDIQKVYKTGSETPESKKFQKIPVKYNNWTWCIILLLRICGLSHYDVMALL